MDLERFGRKIRRVRMTWGLRGIAGLARAVRSRIHSRALSLRLMVELGTWAPLPVVREDLYVRPVTPVELAMVRRRCPQGPLPTEFFLDQLRGMNRCWLSWLRGELAGIFWAVSSEERSSLMELAAEERELRYGYVFPQFRNKGVFKALVTKILCDLKGEGVRRVYSHVLQHNLPSLRAMERAGMRQVGLMETRWTLGVKRVRFKPAEDAARLTAADRP